MQHLESVISRDGTRIAWERRGCGPPLVMVHGSGVDHTRWGGVLDPLAEHFTLYLVDRRGRGASGDAAEYALERELEDVVAVVEAAGEPARLLGHSYGAICALEGACLTSRIARLVLYEPPLPLPDQPSSFAADLAQRLGTLLAAGERAAVAETFLREVLRLRESELTRLRRSASWPVRLDAAATLPREVGMASHYRFRPERFSGLRVPTLFLCGSRSPAYLRAATHMAAAAVPAARVEVLPGQGHAAMTTGPRDFLAAVLPFLR